MAKPVHLGKGVLTWEKSERVTNRYGTVALIPDGETSVTPGEPASLIDELAATHLRGTPGRLYCVVAEPRRSTHMGDQLNKIKPRKPKRLATLVFGHGTLEVEPYVCGGIQVGAKPYIEAPAPTSSDNGFVLARVQIPGTNFYQDATHNKARWMDIRALYDAHESLVDLFWEPELRNS